MHFIGYCQLINNYSFTNMYQVMCDHDPLILVCSTIQQELWYILTINFFFFLSFC